MGGKLGSAKNIEAAAQTRVVSDGQAEICLLYPDKGVSCETYESSFQKH